MRDTKVSCLKQTNAYHHPEVHTYRNYKIELTYHTLAE